MGYFILVKEKKVRDICGIFYETSLKKNVYFIHFSSFDLLVEQIAQYSIYFLLPDKEKKIQSIINLARIIQSVIKR